MLFGSTILLINYQKRFEHDKINRGTKLHTGIREPNSIVLLALTLLYWKEVNKPYQACH